MSDPPRLRDLEGEIPEDVRRLLSRAPGVRPMTARQRSDVSRAALWLTVAPGALVTFWRLGHALAAVALVGSVAVGTAVALRPEPGRPVAHPRALPAPPAARAAASPVARPPPLPSTRRAPLPSLRDGARPMPPAPPAPSAPPPGPAGPAPAGTDSPPAPPAGPPVRDESLTAENAVLLRARSLLPLDPAAALALLGVHAATFTQPQLADEREFMAVEALRRLGRGAEAEARAGELMRRSPGSPYARLLRLRPRPRAGRIP